MSSSVQRKLAVFAAIAAIRAELEANNVRPSKYPPVSLQSEQSVLTAGYAWVVCGTFWGASERHLYMLEKAMMALQTWEHDNNDDPKYNNDDE